MNIEQNASLKVIYKLIIFFNPFTSIRDGNFRRNSSIYVSIYDGNFRRHVSMDNSRHISGSWNTLEPGSEGVKEISMLLTFII